MDTLDDRIEKYLASGGGNCPVCGKDNVEGSSVEIDSGIASQEIYCVDCHSSWTDQYTLTGYSDLNITEATAAEHTDFTPKVSDVIGEDRPEVEASDIELKP